MGFNNAETQESNVYDKIRSLLELYQLFELFEIFQVHDVSIKDTDRPQKCLKIADEIEKLGEDYTILLRELPPRRLGQLHQHCAPIRVKRMCWFRQGPSEGSGW